MFQSHCLTNLNRILLRASSRPSTHVISNNTLKARKLFSRGAASATARTPRTQATQTTETPPGIVDSTADVSHTTHDSSQTSLRQEAVSVRSEALQSWFLAVEKQETSTLTTLAEDLVSRPPDGTANQQETINLVLKLLPRSNLPCPTILSLLRIFDTQGHLERLSFSSIIEFTRLCQIDERTTWPFHTEMLKFLTPIIVHHIHRYSVPCGADILQYTPPSFIKMAFSMVRKLLNASLQPEALSVFGALTQTRHIPEQVTREVDTSSNNFSYILRSTLAHAAVHWGLRRYVGAVLMDIVDDARTPLSAKQDIFSLISSLLDSAERPDLFLCSQVMRKLHESNHTIQSFIPDSLIHRFFVEAHRLNQPNIAQVFYGFMRLPRVLAQHKYPIPQGDTLVWLVTRLCYHKRNDQLARQLVATAVEEDMDIPVGERARFINTAASFGFASQARFLWEKYSVGEHRDDVVGNSSTLLRMTKLYTSLIQRTEVALKKAAALPRPSHEPPDQSDQATAEEAVAKLQERLEDYQRFSDNVLVQFRQHHTPLEKASHFTITSLARTLILKEKYAEAMNTIKVLTARQEVPDIHDVNVALTAVAMHDPRSAAQMIEQMLEKRLIPGPPTFGTVIHQALVHKDYDLAHQVVRFSLEQNCPVDLKSLNSLMRASVHSGDAKPEEVEANIRRAFAVVRLLGSSHIVSSVHSGKYFVRASLAAESPVMAYRFWRELVLNKAEWKDNEHSSLRMAIVRMLTAHQLAGKVNEDLVKPMLTTLRRRRTRLTTD